MSLPTTQQQNPLGALAARLNVDEQTIQNIVVNTLVAAKKNQDPTNEELVTFLAIANEHKLNPLTKEIYAFANHGKVQVIVSIDDGSLNEDKIALLCENFMFRKKYTSGCKG